MNFRTLYGFPRIFNQIKDFEKDKDVNNAWAYYDPHPYGNGLAHGLGSACAAHARGAPTRGSRTRCRHNGATGGGSLVA
jgi:hypothetical protein